MNRPLPGVTFRAAAATDAGTAVPLIYSSGPVAFDFVFSHPARGTAQDFLRMAFGRAAGEFGHATHTVALIDGEVVGIGAVFSGDTALSFSVAAARQILTFYGPRYGPGVALRGLQVEQVVPVPGKGVHYIAHLGVTPERRGQGIGAALVKHFLEGGRALGRTTAALDVAVTNPRAQALYERLGFVVTAEHRSSLGNGRATVADHRRMERPIGPE